MKCTVFYILLYLLTISSLVTGTPIQSYKDTNLTVGSQLFLIAVRESDSTSVSHFLNKMSSTTVNQLANDLPHQNDRLAFWLNIYNGWFQWEARKMVSVKVDKKIFKRKKFPIGNQMLSLNEIEHSIIRRGKWLYGKGYITAFNFKSKYSKMAPFNLDPRIHFALNCGAKSCPPIPYFSPTNLNKALSLAQRQFLMAETEVDSVRHVVKVSKILQWYSGDFGGKKGIRQLLSSYYPMSISNYKVKFKPYDWGTKLGYYSTL